VPGDLKLTDKTGPNTISGFVTDADGKPVEGAMVNEPDSGESAVTDEYGFFSLRAQGDVTGLEITRRGYRKTYFWVKGDEEPVAELERLYSSLPPSTIVTVDPAGGGEEPGWIGPAGNKASDLNLAVAAKLAHLLTSAGVDARLTRRDDLRMTPEERVRANEAAGSDLFITISHSPGAVRAARVGHYHNSRRGIELAGMVKTYFEASLDDTATVAATANYLVQQTSCPAVRVVYTAPDTLMGEEGLAEAAAVWKRAYALFLAALAFRGVQAESTFSIEGKVTQAGEPAPNALVIVDGALEVMTDESGALALDLLERTDHTIQAYSTTGRSAPSVFNHESAFLEIELE
jgi:N-acetylmuramoyl-L-alanine amidase